MAELISEDSIETGGKEVVEKMLADLPGGVELDVTDVAAEDTHIAEGTPIILDGGAYKPLIEANLAADAAKVVGILFREIPKAQPYASVCIRGVVNEAKLPFSITPQAAAVKGAVPGISWI